MTRTAIVISLACMALTAVAAVFVILRVTEGGPLRGEMLGGQPDFSVEGGMTSPGQVTDFGIWVFNTAHDPLTLVSASLIPVRGHPTARLAVLKVDLRSGGLIVGGRGSGVPTAPFRGARLHRGRNEILFGVAGDRIGGFYMVAGLYVTYRYHGQLYTMNAWSATTLCVVGNRQGASWTDAAGRRCTQAENIDQHATEQMAGV
jgi:hypothetical protein